MGNDKKRVFVSYSHQDSDWKKRFETILKPVLNDQTEIDWWHDGELEVSDNWHAKIQAALHQADLYVCLVSGNFLASNYIGNEELPEMLRRRLKQQARIACLYIEPSLVDRKTFEVMLERGKVEQVKLTDYQALNTSDVPIANLSGNAEQNTALVEAAGKLLDMLQELPQHQAPIVKPAAPEDRYVLNLKLQWQANEVVCHYFDQAQLLLEQHYDGEPFRSAIGTWQRLEHTQLSETDFTDALFRLLFGPGEVDNSNRLLQQIAGASEGDRPTRHAVRVRIYSDDAAIRNLPWHVATFEAQSLLDSHWIFELRARRPEAGYSNEPSITLEHPTSAVILHPGLSGQADASGGMLTSVLSRLRKELEKSLPRHYSSWQALREQLGGVNSDLLYFIGQASERDGRVWLHLREGEREQQVPADKLTTIPGLSPKVLFLNLLCHPPIELHALCVELAGRIPVVLIQQAEPVREKQLERCAADWLADWQIRGDAPTAAFHRKGYWRQTSYSAYEGFHTRQLQVRRIEKDLAVLLLDRHRQREAISNALRRTVDRSEARLLSALACADRDNLIERFPEQLMKTLDSSEGVEGMAVVESIAMSWPRDGITWTVATLEEALKESLNSDPNRDLGRVLEERKPSAPAKQNSVLLLHWPVVKTWPAENERKAIVDFWTLRLAPKCPKGLRILALLLFEIDAQQHHLVDEFREDVTIDHTGPRFDLVEVEPLDKIKRGDLVKYLNREESGCDQELIRPLSRLVVEKTGGTFHDTTRLLQKGMQYGWENLREELAAATTN